MDRHRSIGRHLSKILFKGQKEQKETEKRICTKRAIGSQYEKVAGAYLEKKGYRILAYNFYCRDGEIDLIAEKDGVIVFCEVKYRSRGRAGHPLETVTKAKRRKICRCALYYLMHYGYDTGQACRFDVIGILGEKIVHLENAFMYSD